MSIPDEHREWFEEDRFAAFATVSPDDSIHLTPVWVDHDGGRVLVNTLRGRRKEKNVRRDPRVALMILDPEDPYRYVSVQGRVVEFTEEGAADHYRDLAMRYTGEEGRYERRYGDEERSRVILAIEVEDLIAVDID
jgi:PPOX class probable F420-dependent enzyme